MSESGLISLFMGEKAISRNEHTSNVLAFRRAATLGLVAWTLFGLTDWFVVTFVEPGRLWLYLAARGLGVVVIGLVTLRLHRAPLPSPRLLRALDVATFTTASALVSLTSLELRGIESPLTAGVITILVCRTALVPDRWQRGLLPIGLTAAIHPLVLLGLTLVSPRMAAQLHSPQALGGFLLNQSFLFGAAAIGVIGSHKMWALRRQVYEARNLGRYRLKKRIGRGGMGEVWVAHHVTLGRDVAVKILRPDKMDEEAIVRFEREVRTTSELSHPNTVRVFDFGVTEDGLCYFAMELLEGQDLSSLLKEAGPLTPARVVRIALQTSNALAEAHRRGIVHRDLKPGNLLLTRAGMEEDFVKVVDFGLALVRSTEHDSAVTHTGFIVGTPAYIAPELLSGQPADERSDIYSLGALSYELLCGLPPFAERDQRRMLMARTREHPPPPSSILGRSLPSALEAIVLLCLRKDPAERFQTAVELAEALTECDLGCDDPLGPLSPDTDEVLTFRVPQPASQPDRWAPTPSPRIGGAEPDRTIETARPAEPSERALEELDYVPDTIVDPSRRR